MQSWEEEGSCCHLVLSKTFMNEWSQSTVQWKAREASHNPRLDDYTFWTIHPSVELANEQNWHEGPWSLLEGDEPPLKLLILTEHVPVNLCKLQKLPAAPPTCACRESQEDVQNSLTTHTPLTEVQGIPRSFQPILLASCPGLPCRQTTQGGGRESRCLVYRWAQKYFPKPRQHGDFHSRHYWVSPTPTEDGA